MRIICFTSVQVTAWMPPSIVYATVGTPISATHHSSGHPKTAEKTTPGAAMIVPHAAPLERRKRKAVNDRAPGPNRCSRYSYAV